jgi:hypothetical protein
MIVILDIVHTSRSAIVALFTTMPIGLDVQVHAEALMRQQRSLVREYPPPCCPLLSVLPRRRGLFAFRASSRRTRQPIVIVTAIRIGSAIRLLRCLLALTISTIIVSRQLHLPVDLLLLLALLCGAQFFLMPPTHLVAIWMERCHVIP